MPGLWSEIKVIFVALVAVLHAFTGIKKQLWPSHAQLKTNLAMCFLYIEFPNNLSSDGISNI